ncbi:MAG: T9SS type A sorting domain-containing protein [Bacteroidetes bacterium]|jgi:hypothetical protein|nr:T9SS type A sorting domain-containing protein [Bacteroidota bacterium]
MKKHYLITLLLGLCLMFTAQNASAQNIRLLEVNPATDEITLKNFGSSAQNVGSWWVCSLFVYQQISNLSITNGNMMMMPNDEIIFTGFSLNDSSSDLGLYNSNSFGSSTAMEDFVQWGAGGQGRESVAVAKGIWTAGDFLSSSGPFAYQGNGTQNGLGFWTTLSLDDFLNASQIVLYPNPAESIIILENLSQYPITTIFVFDAFGKKVNAFNNLERLDKTQLNISALNSGLYLFKVFDDQNNFVTQKVIIK